MNSTTPDRKTLVDGIAVYRRLLGYAVPYWRMLVIAVLAMAGYAALNPIFARLIQSLIDGSLVHEDPDVLRESALILVGLSVVRGVVGFASDYCSGWVGRRIIADLRRELFDQFLHLPCTYYDRASSGQLLARMLYNTDQVENALSKGIVAIFQDSFTILGLTALMVYENPLLSLVFLVVGPVLGLGTRLISQRFRRISMRIQESMGNVGHVAQEVIEAQRIVKVFNGKRYEMEKFGRENEINRRREVRLIATNALSGAIIQFIYIGGIAAILYVASLDTVRNTVTPGSLVAFVAAMAMMLSPIKRVTQVIGVLQRGIAAGESVFEILDAERERDSGTIELDQVRGTIEYRNVSLSYRADGAPALRQIELRIAPGKTVALVGHSGSGKTSLIRLLPRLYEPTEGEIYVDGRNICHVTLESLRRHIAYVGQEVTLFNDTVANNIAYGCRGKIAFERIRRAAEAAHALEFIERLPQGFETVVGQQGVVLSGGQRQRIAIARALLKDAPILILDEATSALDAESERYVQEALEALMRNRTTLVIAHRLSTIQNADRIYVMREGRIIEQGTHEQLLSGPSHYRDLYRMQFGQRALEGAGSAEAKR
ncbi:lipid A export permease/ATP-binding protein MsbA [Candidatus Methylocalor cossyra]